MTTTTCVHNQGAGGRSNNPSKQMANCKKRVGTVAVVTTHILRYCNRHLGNVYY